MASEGARGRADVWTLQRGEADFPSQLAARPHADRWPTLHGLGNRDILGRKCLGLVCSVQCPGSIVIRTFDAIRELRDAGVVVAGGFHSPMEKECLDFLLRGDQPVILCPARTLDHMRLPPALRNAVESGRLLLLSPFDAKARRVTGAQAHARNEFVAALAAAVLIPHAAPGGKTKAIARTIVERRQPLFTFDDPANKTQLEQGAGCYHLERVRCA